MKYIVTYSSKYGSTQKYAKWIGEALSCEVKDIKDIPSGMLQNYDVIIHGGGLYAGGVSGMKQFHFRGGIDYSRLSLIHRAMMWMLCQTMKKKGYDNLSDEDKLMLDTYGKKIDFSDQSTIKVLVDYVSAL